VAVRPVFSVAPTDGVVFMQDRLWADRAEVIELVGQGAVFFVCGDGRHMAPAVHDACARIYTEATGATQEQADAWMTEMERERGRYVADVFV
jgi:cytochrome P450 / NADPH-cytochrome P450 reductase